MIPELGHFALMLALAIALVQTIVPLVGAQLRIPNWMAVARPAAFAHGFAIAFSFGCLAYSFMVNDFSVQYVANHSNSALPAVYRFSAVWGGHEGSLLLWSMMLVFWTVAVAIFSRSLAQDMAVRVIAVMGFVSCGFLLFMLATSNPFDRVFPAPMDGRDLNPLLQDPGLVIHPPLLYMGYVGFSVAFAFAVAALLGGKLDSAWARWSRPWTAIAWVFLTLGIALGSWWAYYELGWGGWWFWDPVENASFMPWLVGTALMHSLAVTEKRGSFKNWTVLLAITTFSLSLLGTFLVRSGVLTSVHAFATDPARGVFILIFLCVVIGISLALYAWRAPSVGVGARFEGLSRETALLVNNILLVVAAGSVLLGTLYPLFLDALGMGKISVGPPYFGTVFFWLMVPLVAVLGIGPLLRWQSDKMSNLLDKIKIIAPLSVVAGLAISALTVGFGGFTVVLAIIGAIWIVLATVQSIREKTRYQTKLSQLPRSYYGMVIAHLGVAMFIVGATITNTYSIEKDVRIEVGKALEVGELSFLMTEVNKVAGPNYDAHRGTVEVSQNGNVFTVLHPEKRFYRVQTMPMTEAAIDPGFTRDVYVALGEPLSDNAWSMRVYYKPFVRWTWLGALLMSLGGLLAALDKRYQRLAKATSKQRDPATQVA
jgi:cytochrome c-type biogenesis protein CcmF